MNYIWHHIHSLWYHTTLWHHTPFLHVITSRIPVITSTVARPLLIGYWLYHTYYLCDMKHTIYMTSQEFYMTSPSLFMTKQYCIHDVTSNLCGITYTILAKSEPLYLWKDFSYVYDIILSIYDISHGVWMTIQPQYLTSHSQYLCNHTTWLMISHPLYVWNHTHCM